VVHSLPSSVQPVPLVFLASAGQAAALPGQFSWRSHSPAAPRHDTVDGWKASAGQVAADPLQVSATSQVPADVRHVEPDALKTQIEVQHDVAAPFDPP
jgi:hypothetical protein